MRVYVYASSGWIIRCKIKSVRWGFPGFVLDERWYEAGTQIALDLSRLPPAFIATHANLKRAVFELRRVLADGDGALEARVVECLGIVL